MTKLPKFSIKVRYFAINSLIAVMQKELMDVIKEIKTKKILFHQDANEFLLITMNMAFLVAISKKVDRQQIGKEFIKIEFDLAQAMAFFSFWNPFEGLPPLEQSTLRKINAEILEHIEKQENRKLL